MIEHTCAYSRCRKPYTHPNYSGCCCVEHQRLHQAEVRAPFRARQTDASRSILVAPLNRKHGADNRD